MQWVASCVHQEKCITEQLEGRKTNTYFHLMGGEVDLEHNNEFSLVDSGQGPRLSGFFHHLGNSDSPLWSLASHS